MKNIFSIHKQLVRSIVIALFSFVMILSMALVTYSSSGPIISSSYISIPGNLEIGGNTTTTGNINVLGSTTLATTTFFGNLTLSNIVNFLSNLIVAENATTTGNQVISGALNVVSTSTLSTLLLNGDIRYGTNNSYDIGKNLTYRIFKDDFERTDTSPGTLGTASTGQTWAMSGPGYLTGRVLSGRFVSPSNLNIYAGITIAANPTKIGGQVSWAPGAPTTAGVSLITQNDSQFALSNMLHLVVNRSTWALQRNENGGAITGFTGAGGTFSPTLSDDGTVYNIAMTIEGNIAFIDLPDGTRATVINPQISRLNGPYLIWQISSVATGATRWESVYAEALSTNGTRQPRDLRIARNAIISGKAIISGNAAISGKVGIGTSSPSENLHIFGSYPGGGDQQGIIIEDTVSSADPYIRLTSGSDYWDTQIMGSGSGISNVSLDFNYGTSSFATFLKSGNVGIGTTTPSSLLNLYSAATTTLSVDSGSTTKGACLKFKDSDGSGYTYCIANNGTMTCGTASCE